MPTASVILQWKFQGPGTPYAYPKEPQDGTKLVVSLVLAPSLEL